ncbi:MAG: flippase-like domain-containing protein, partial [Actinobacteria bacterium]|nr:flippase-like domain-containing protein [Actinomycetota bacterium]
VLGAFTAHHLEAQAEDVALFLAVGAALSIAASVAVAWHAGFHEVADHARHVNPLWFAVALAGAVAAHIGYMLAFREVARVDDGLPIGIVRTGAIVATGFGVFVPRGGFALDVEALTDMGVPVEEARIRVLGLGSLEYVVLGTAAAACSILMLLWDFHAQQAVTLSWAIGVPAGTLLALIALRFRKWLCRGWFKKVIGPPLEALLVVGKILARPRQHATAAIFGMSLYFAGEVFVLWACLAAFQHGGPSILAVVVGYATGYALTRRTLPLAGAGAVEALMPFALAWVDFKLAAAVLAVFAYRLFNVWLPVPPSLAGLIALQRRPPTGSVAYAEVGRHDGDGHALVDARARADVHR